MDAFDFELRQAQGQRSDTWIQDRLGKFTASEIHRLIGEPKSTQNKEHGLTDAAQKYCWEKIGERLSGVPASNEFINERMMRGIELESVARAEFEKASGLTVTDAVFVPFTECAGGSPDGYVGHQAIVEIKCPDTDTHLQYRMIQEDSDFPKAYYWQIQANLLFTNSTWCYFISYDDRLPNELKLFWIKISADEDAHAELVRKIEQAETFCRKMINQLTA